MKNRSCAQCGTVFAGADRGRPRNYCSRACQARAYRARKDAGRLPRRTVRATPSPRGYLDRAEIVRHAIQLADADGLNAVSLRTLAYRSGVPAMSLYRHISGKDDLVSAMVDTVLERDWQPWEGAGGWRARLEHEARQEWELYQRHHWVLSVLATTRTPINRSVLTAIDRSMTTLTSQGLDPSTALSVYLMISGYVQGAALLPTAELQAVRDSGISSGHWWAHRLRQLAGAVESGSYPWLTTLATTPAAHGPSDNDIRAWFDFGLQRVLDGVAAFLIDQNRESTPGEGCG